MSKRFFAATLATFLLAGCSANAQTGLASTGRSPASAETPPDQSGLPGMVSAADPRAAEAGVQMLRQGGSATDAAIATMLALTVVEPQSSGIGGGGFYVRGDASGQVETIDGRETAPKAAGPDWFLDQQGQSRPFMEAVMSGLSVGVPGNIALAVEAHERHGKLPWSALFQPAIKLAREGWTLSPRFAEFLGFAGDRARLSDEGAALFFDPSGAPLPAGTVVRNPTLAATLEMIAAGGRDAFYSGKNAQAIAEVAAGATPYPAGMAESDVTQYQAKLRAPVCAAYRVYRICGMGPPSSGATTVLAILKQLEHFDLAAFGPDNPTFWHVFAESQRLAYADRALYLGDSDFVSVPVSGLVDDDYTAGRGALISPDKSLNTVEAGVPPMDGHPVTHGLGEGPEEQGTSHFVAVDRWDNAVSYTSTVEGSFGSGLMVGGYYLNNELTDFSFMPDQDGVPVANRVEGGKRPRSSMAPTVVYAPDGKVLLAVGAAGGATIPVQVARALVGVLDFGLTPQAAVALPVLYAPGDTVFIEQGSSLEAMIPALTALGHANVTPRRLPLKTNAALRGPTGWDGAADPRSEGAAISE